MADKARKWTDKQLKAIEKKLSNIYGQAKTELSETWSNYMISGKKELDSFYDAFIEASLNGDADLIEQTRKLYQDALQDYTLNNEYYQGMVDNLTDSLANINQKALVYINQKMIPIYVRNKNEVSVLTKQLDNLGIKFNLTNEHAVNRLIREGKVKLPKKKFDVPRDKRWNTKQLNSSLLQGILQGESMDEIAQRILPIVDNNETAAIRNARTMVTGAENRGKLDRYEELEEKGIVLNKIWKAVGDKRTRDWHRVMNGQEIKTGEKFVDGNNNELEYPGDPTAKAETVYNCRCGMKVHIIGFKNDDGTIRYIDKEYE